MGATYRKRQNKHGCSWLVTVHVDGEREFKTVTTKGDAEALVREIHKQELAGINVIETIRSARARRTEPVASAPSHPALCEALPLWISAQETAGEIRASTAS